MKKEEQIREAVRKVINQMIDEEFASVMKEVAEGRETVTSKSLDEIFTELMKPIHDK
jgi:predicted DNA-binding protein